MYHFIEEDKPQREVATFVQLINQNENKIIVAYVPKNLWATQGHLQKRNYKTTI